MSGVSKNPESLDVQKALADLRERVEKLEMSGNKKPTDVCKTCGGSGYHPSISTCSTHYIPNVPCPDCKPKEIEEKYYCICGAELEIVSVDEKFWYRCKEHTKNWGVNHFTMYGWVNSSKSLFAELEKLPVCASADRLQGKVLLLKSK